jgi:serine phosphatase RsbU (regulator of sigma subunit)/anti-sigma regulatory factor (Ser/Thr protein kinase)
MAGDRDRQAAGPGDQGTGSECFVLEQGFDVGSLYALRAAVAAHAAKAGLSRQRVYDVTAAAHELAANAVMHGAGRGRVRLWAGGQFLCCQVSDDGQPGVAVPWPAEHGHGLWLVGQVADQLSIDHGPAGTTVTAQFLLRPVNNCPNPLQCVLMVAEAQQLRILLVEDDDGDALLIEELLTEAGAAVEVQRARLLADATELVHDAACVLLDLGLPDSQGLDGLRGLLKQEPDAAVVVLTGLADEHLGAEAVRAGAQDYLVKGEVTGKLLHRVIRYAMERRRWDEAQRQLHIARVSAQENARLERGLLPSPVLDDERLAVSTRYRVGGNQRLVGGDFYDLVQTPDGWVHVLIGDVCGRGPSQAALGVCLRVAWRALVLAGRPSADVLSAVQLVLKHEQQEEAMFATVCMVSVAPDRHSGILRLAGHPGPLLVTPERITELTAPTCLPPGFNETGDWPAREVKLGDQWSLLLYTDGLIEGRVGQGPQRLGTEGLMDLVRDALGGPPLDAGRVTGDTLLNDLIDEVRSLNGGDLDDDLAVLVLGYS